MNRILRWVDDAELNPIVVKELRQAVRSWAVVGALILLTLMLFFTVMGMVGFSAGTLNPSSPVGRNVLEVIIPILNFVGIIFIPSYVGGRMAAERQSGNHDLLYISTLSPARIIRGKLFSGAYLALLFYCICLPFMFFTNLLRGVDLPTIAAAVGLSYLLVVAAIQVAIFLAAAPLTKAFKAVMAMGMLFFVIPMVMGFVFASFAMFRGGIGSSLVSWNFLPGLILGVAGVGLLHILSIAMITPPAANRAFPVRVYISTVWFLGAVAAWAIYLLQKQVWALQIWLSVFITISLFAFLAAVSEPEQYSLRLRREIPGPLWRRIPAFFLFNGACGGLLWAGFGVLATLVTAWAGTDWLSVNRGYPNIGLDEADRGRLMSLILYVLAYALYGASLRRWFFPRRSPMLAGVFGVVLPTLWLIVPMLVSFIWNNFRFDILGRVHLGDPVNVFMPKMEAFWSSHLLCAGVMAIIGLLPNMRWMIRGIRDFRPLEGDRTSERSE